MDSSVDSEFPTVALLPKKETGVLNFLAKYPQYDGRGVVIAVFDSGVDPNAAGLKETSDGSLLKLSFSRCIVRVLTFFNFQETSDGKPKVIERFNCSGAGDIDTSTIIKPTNDEIKGLSGRTLKIPSKWKNPSGEYRIGLRNCYDLLNKCMKDRVLKKRKEKLWENSHKTIYAKCSQNVQDFNKECANKKELARDDKLKKEELENQVDVLNTLDKKFNDPGAVYDFVLYHDGNQWWAVMDTSEIGDLESCALLTEFSLNPRSYSTFPADEPFTYSFNVYDDGNILEIVTCASSHGTHVASIAAAYFPDDPSKNGVAPGAQIISLTIGDNRLGTMETGTALSRAMIRVIQNCKKNKKKIHVINMSYGEMSYFSNTGRIGDLMNEVIDKYGVVWIASAGNRGPALFTIGTPPNISTTNIIGVGAFVSPEMMSAEYSMREKLPATCYSWSSRGPTLDGDRGITVCAPGGAITSVPNYTLKSSELLSGTSMAAPHVSGAVALLISGLLQRNIKYSPYFIKRTLENTASFHSSYDYFAQGCGLLQVEKAFDHLLSYHKENDCNVRFHISCSNTGAKGIVIRSGNITDTNVSVEPVFLNKDEIDPQIKINFNINLVLICDAPWVQVPKYLALMNTNRTFVTRVDPSNLAVGAHGTNIRAYDTCKPEKGPVFRVQITVIKPHVFDSATLKPEFQWKDVTFIPHTISRHFIKVPIEVTWAALNIEVLPTSKEKSGRFLIHCLQKQSRKSCRTLEFHKMIQIYDRNEAPLVFPVKAGVILEVTVAKFWSSIGEMKLNYSLQFAGCRPSQPEFVMHHADGLYSIDINPGLQTEEIQFNAQLKNNITVLKPSESNISPLNSERDVLPPTVVIYQLVLMYNFHISKSTEVTLISPLLSEYLYESDYESQIWMLFDSNKKYIITGDAYPENYSIKLEKGDYVVRQQVRHDRKDLLEKLNEMSLLLSQKLPNCISLDAYTSSSNVTFGKKLKSVTLVGRTDIEYPLYIAPISNDKLPKSVTVGQYLSGTIVLTKDRLGKKVDSYPLKYILSEASKKNNKSSDIPVKTKEEEFDDAYKEFMTGWISRFDADDKLAQQLYTKMTNKIKDHLLIHTAMLQNLEPESKRYLPGFLKETPTKEYLLRVIFIADAVINHVNQAELLAFLGTRSDQQAEVAPKTKTFFTQQKTALVEAIGRKGCAMCQYFLLHNDTETESKESTSLKVKLDEIDALWLNLLKYVDSQDAKGTYYFALWHAAAFSHYGRLVKLLLKLCEDKCTNEIDSCLRWTFSQLNWDHCYRIYSDKLLVHYPSQYQLF